jgi:sugar phosphate isomerase/epimerase
MVEDVPRALASLGEELCLVHASDTRRSEWLHDPLGTAEVPWPVVTAALAKKAYTGRVVLETLHEGDPVRGFAADAAVWASAGGGGGSSRSGDGS